MSAVSWETACPLADLRLEGDPDGVFDLVPAQPGAADALREAMDAYPETLRGRLTVHRPEAADSALWMHPGEPVFERFCAALLARQAREALRGAIFIDPHAEAPYLLHLAQTSLLRRSGNAWEVVESRPVGLRQEGGGSIATCPLEHLLLLRGAHGIPPGSVPLARQARRLAASAAAWLKESLLPGMAQEARRGIRRGLPERLRWAARGYDYRIAELMAKRRRLRSDANRGEAGAQAELAVVKQQQDRLIAEKQRGLAPLEAGAALVEPGEARMIARALVLPADDPDERRRHDARVEAIAMERARAHEEAAGAVVHDVSRPELARRRGLGDWPGFDLHSRRPAGPHGPEEVRAIEVKGRAASAPSK